MVKIPPKQFLQKLAQIYLAFVVYFVYTPNFKTNGVGVNNFLKGTYLDPFCLMIFQK